MEEMDRMSWWIWLCTGHHNLRMTEENLKFVVGLNSYKLNWGCRVIL